MVVSSPPTIILLLDIPFFDRCTSFVALATTLANAGGVRCTRSNTSWMVSSTNYKKKFKQAIVKALLNLNLRLFPSTSDARSNSKHTIYILIAQNDPIAN